MFFTLTEAMATFAFIENIRDEFSAFRIATPHLYKNGSFYKSLVDFFQSRLRVEYRKKTTCSCFFCSINRPEEETLAEETQKNLHN